MIRKKVEELVKAASLLLFGVLVTMLIPFTASAHAYVIQSSPTVNQSLTGAPSGVEVTFDESVQLSADGLTVTDQDGNRVDRKDSHRNPSNPHMIECTVPATLGKGVYTVHWQVLSEDGHMVQGTIPFGVGVDVQSLHLGATEAGYTPGPAQIVDRTLFYISMALVIGLSVYFRFLWPSPEPPVRKKRLSVLLGAWITLIVTTALSLPLQTAITWDVHGLGSFSGKYLLRTLNLTLFGNVWLIQMLLVLICPPIIALLMNSSRKSMWFFASLPIMGIPITKSFIGHAVSHRQPVLPVIANAIHLYAASIWLGGMVGVAMFVTHWYRTRETSDEHQFAPAIRRFSAVAGTSVIVLGATGLYAALINIPTWYALWNTSYGRTLVVKLGLFVVMVLVALFHWTRRSHLGAKSFRSMVLFESSVGFGILMATSVLTNLPTAVVNPGPVHVDHNADGHHVTLSITPNHAGNNEFEVDITDAKGRGSEDIQQVSLSFESRAVKAGSESVRLQSTKPGKYVTTGLYLSGGGQWSVDVHVLTTDFSDIDETFQITVGQ